MQIFLACVLCSMTAIASVEPANVGGFAECRDLTEDDQQVLATVQSQVRDQLAPFGDLTVTCVSKQIVAGVIYQFKVEAGNNGKQVVTVRQYLSGTLELQSVTPDTDRSVDSQPPVDPQPSVDSQPQNAGGYWSDCQDLTDEDGNILKQVEQQVRSLLPAYFLVLSASCVKKQVVSGGLNYQFLVAAGDNGIKLVTVYRPLTGELQLTSVTDVPSNSFVVDTSSADAQQPVPPGEWTQCGDLTSEDYGILGQVEQDVRDELLDPDFEELSPDCVSKQQLDNGVNYQFLVNAGGNGFQAVSLFQANDGSLQLQSVESLEGTTTVIA